MTDFVLDFAGAILGLIGYTIFRIVFGVYRNIRRAWYAAWKDA